MPLAVAIIVIHKGAPTSDLVRELHQYIVQSNINLKQNIWKLFREKKHLGRFGNKCFEFGTL